VLKLRDAAFASATGAIYGAKIGNGDGVHDRVSLVCFDVQTIGPRVLSVNGKNAQEAKIVGALSNAANCGIMQKP
jgi:hypothetical protein